MTLIDLQTKAYCHRLSEQATCKALNLTMFKQYGVEDYNLRYMLDTDDLGLGDSRSPSQISQKNLQILSHVIHVYASACAADHERPTH